MELCSMCPVKCALIDKVNRDAVLAQRSVDAAKNIIGLWNTSKKEKEELQQKIEDINSDHQGKVDGWKKQAVLSLCPNLDDVP